MLRRPRSATPLHWLAPCGIDCRLCRAYQREKDPCPGCRAGDAGKPKTRVLCRIKTCPTRAAGHHQYCCDCPDFPCDRLVPLDQRYRTKYGLSVIETLVALQDLGPARFVEYETRKWACPRCGAMVCMHEPLCPGCGHRWRD